MLQPSGLEIDFRANAGYLRYRALPEGQFVTRSQRVHDAVHADFNAESEVLGIELLGFDDEALAAARRFADDNGLEFPELLTRTGPGSGLHPVTLPIAVRTGDVFVTEEVIVGVGSRR